MSMTVIEKIQAVRKIMALRGAAAMIIPSTDPHQSEYVGPRWQVRQWLSGFTGSAGTLVVTARHAGLWTDSRYFLQAERELKRSGIMLFKSREPGVPGVNEWIARQLKPGQLVAFDSRVMSMESVRDMKTAFAPKRIKVRGRPDWIDLIWPGRPVLAGNPIVDFPVKYAGQSRAGKLAAVRDRLKDKRADGLLLSSLDDIAWLFNIRGCDTEHSPVVTAFALIEARRATLFADQASFPPGLKRDLRKANVLLKPYASIASHLKALAAVKSLLLNPRRISQWLAGSLPASVAVIEDTTDITTDLKAIKNPVEQGHLREAALWDGVALVKFFAWLDRTLGAGKNIDEYEAGRQLSLFRRESPECKGESFETICGYGANAAVIHYSAKPQTAGRLARRGLLLVDSGGNYFQGTMDTTRTVALGPVSQEARRSYTAVLKGVISLSRAQFPAGTTGTHLDALVRAPLWAQGLNFKHGSGHGVGFYLNVHEGPHGISPTWNACALKPGMVVTIEPGVYVRGQYGIRTENMVLVTAGRSTQHGTFHGLETLTLCPIDTVPLIPAMLNADEKAWLNHYHLTVWRKLSPLLGRLDRAWLKRKTEPI